MNAELANLAKEIGRIANERRIVQEIKAIANLEHRYNTYNSSWSTVSSYWKEKSNEQPRIH